MSNQPRAEEQVIDLTDEPDHPPQHTSHHRGQQESGDRTSTRRHRPPRFGANILDDVVDLEEGDNDESPGSPEVQFMGGRRNSDVEFVRSTTRSSPARHRSIFSRTSDIWDIIPLFSRAPFLPLNRRPISRDPTIRIRGPTLNFPQQHPREEETLWINGTGGMDLTIDFPDYPGIGSPFDPRPREPAYKPPSPAPEGFTRNIQEHDIVVCPNCEDELGTGDECKQQIWVVKQCGHVSALLVMLKD